MKIRITITTTIMITIMIIVVRTIIITKFDELAVKSLRPAVFCWAFDRAMETSLRPMAGRQVQSSRVNKADGLRELCQVRSTPNLVFWDCYRSTICHGTPTHLPETPGIIWNLGLGV